ncbi:MAG TPA: TIGR03862 family flavoprotein [Caulobacteraceae bacterium]|jgi:hypothetical protein
MTDAPISSPQKTVAIIGGGPAGLMAAERLTAAGVAVSVYERMPSFGRRLLMAGRGGLNLTHAEPLDRFLTRYGAAGERLEPILRAFPPQALTAWAEGLGQPTFVGSSDRVFPKALKASPLLRAWLGRLAVQRVELLPRHDWLGWDLGAALSFRRADGEVIAVRPDAVILALGGASWPRLGSTGAWVEILERRGVKVHPLQPANCGFIVPWTDLFRSRFQGQALKGVALSFGGQQVRGEALVTAKGLEGSAIYALSAALRNAIATGGSATIQLDLRPDESVERLAAKLAQVRRGDSLSTRLRRALNLAPVAIGLLREAHGVALPSAPDALATAIKAAPVTLTAAAPIDRAISTAGGIAFDAVDDNLMLRALPGVYAVGEMLDWEAPTGGYLLQACFATGMAAAEAVLRADQPLSA